MFSCSFSPSIRKMCYDWLLVQVLMPIDSRNNLLQHAYDLTEKKKLKKRGLVGSMVDTWICAFNAYTSSKTASPIRGNCCSLLLPPLILVPCYDEFVEVSLKEVQCLLMNPINHNFCFAILFSRVVNVIDQL